MSVGLMNPDIPGGPLPLSDYPGAPQPQQSQAPQLPPGVSLPGVGPQGAMIQGGGAPPNPNNIVTDQQRQQMGGTQGVGADLPPFDWVPKFSPAQNRIIATLNDQKSHIQQAASSGVIRPQEAQFAMGQVDQQIAQIRPQLIPKMREPSMEEEAQKRIYVHPETGTTFIRQPDGNFEMRPPSKESPYLAMAKQQHEVAHESAKDQHDLDKIRLQADMKQQLEQTKQGAKDDQFQQKQQRQDDAKTQKQQAAEEAEFRKWYSSAYDRHTQRLTQETTAIDANGQQTKQRQLPNPDDVHGAVMNEWSRLNQAVALRRQQMSGSAPPQQQPQGQQPMQPLANPGPHPLLMPNAPADAHGAAHELDDMVAKFGADPKKWAPQARAHARQLQGRAKAFAKGQ